MKHFTSTCACKIQAEIFSQDNKGKNQKEKLKRMLVLDSKIRIYKNDLFEVSDKVKHCLPKTFGGASLLKAFPYILTAFIIL